MTTIILQNSNKNIVRMSALKVVIASWNLFGPSCRAEILAIFLLLFWKNRCLHKFILSVTDLYQMKGMIRVFPSITAEVPDSFDINCILLPYAFLKVYSEIVYSERGTCISLAILINYGYAADLDEVGCKTVAKNVDSKCHLLELLETTA